MKPHEYVILEISRERERQMGAEGWTLEHDDTHDKGEMAAAASCYASTSRSLSDRLWPWDLEWFKRTDRRRDLVKAGALIVAEIERLDRAAQNRS